MYLNVNGDRGAGKTEMLVSYATSLLRTRSDYSILFLCANRNQAKAVLQRIRPQLAANITHATTNSLILKNKSDINVVGYSRHMGNGKRVDCVIIDDVDLLSNDDTLAILALSFESKHIVTSSLEPFEF